MIQENEKSEGRRDNKEQISVYRYFCSLTFCHTIFFFSAILLFTVILTYLNVNNSTLSLTKINEERVGNFKNSIISLNFFRTLAQSETFQFNSVCDYVGEKLSLFNETDENGVKRNERTVMKVDETAFREFEKSMKIQTGLDTYAIGHYMYEQVEGTWIQSKIFVQEGSKRELGTYYNSTHIAFQEVTFSNTETLPDEYSDVQFYNIEPISSLKEMMTEEKIISYATKHSRWDYWIGESPVLPWLSFSISNPLIIPNSSRNVSCNSWIGISIPSFSAVLKERTPIDTVTWLIDLNQKYLLGSSQYSDISDVMDLENNDWINVEDTKNPVISTISKTIFEDAEILNQIRNLEEDVFSMDRNGYNILISYSNCVGEEWIIVNVKSFSELYVDTIFAIGPTVAFSVGCVIFVFFGFLLLSSCSFLQLRNLFKNLKKIKEMRLDLVEKNWFLAFNELRIINKNVLMMSERLYKFKTFLPAHLLHSMDEFSSAGSSGYSKSNDSDEDENEVELDDQGKFDVGVSCNKVLCMIIQFSQLGFGSSMDFGRLFNRIEFYGGQIISFSSSSVLVTFYADHQTAFPCIESIKLKFETVDEDSTNLHFIVGIGQVFVGNIGSVTRKTYTCEGPLIEELEYIKDNIPIDLSCSVVINEECYQYLQNPNLDNHYETRYINTITYLKKSSYGVFLKLYELGNKIIKTSNEGIVPSTHERWKDYVEAIQKYEINDFQKARTSIQKFLKLQPSDRLGFYWAKKIQQELDCNYHVTFEKDPPNFYHI